MHHLRSICRIIFVFLLSYATNSLAQCISINNVPYIVNKPGTYCLTRDLYDNRNYGISIEIKAHNVTIDLQGHTLRGKVSVDDVTTSTRGIAGYVKMYQYLTVRNGSLRDYTTAISMGDQKLGGI